MAPRRGGSGGSGGSSGSSLSCDSDADYPCTSGLYELYGHTITFYDQAELYGQLVPYVIWCLALGFVFVQTLKFKTRWLQAAILSFLIAFVFLCARFGLLISESDVPIGYRFESSIVVLGERIGMVFLIAGLFPPESRKLFKMLFYPILALCAGLNIAYIVLDFLLSAAALNQYKDSWTWWLSDRDFGLTLTSRHVRELKLNSGYDVSPFYVEDKVFDGFADYHSPRSIHIKIGVAADFLALALAVFIAILAGVPRLRTKATPTRGTIWLRVAAAGLILSTLFRVIIATHYVLWNWSIFNDFSRWVDWIDTYTYDENLIPITVGTGFVEGYRTTVNGFPIVEALLQPLGIVLACAAMAHWWRIQRQTVRSVGY
ncbi:hypothetical protein BDV95DRAFT_570954 [Massariosphaeria phaeospora]|uniref:Uncharacterized protein n=1 Tax=Massariosphaeria phaeospora TaxID=100035 RepID=A0A7C8MAP0_9PLEO|nr:hypothetical protein BDV95DRAFT_570954 [Massariosphaeria phaeospora]